MTKREKIGVITVDAGIVQVGDPCYTSDGRNHCNDWSKFCDILFENRKNGVTNIEHDTGTPGKAIIVSTAHGDGIYPVYIKRDNEGAIIQLIVDFK